MPSGVRRRAAMKAGRDVKYNKRQIAKKREQRKQRELKRALSANPIIAANWDSKLTMEQK